MINGKQNSPSFSAVYIRYTPRQKEAVLSKLESLCENIVSKREKNDPIYYLHSFEPATKRERVCGLESGDYCQTNSKGTKFNLDIFHGFNYKKGKYTRNNSHDRNIVAALKEQGVDAWC